LLEFQDRRILLPGDLESPGTEAVVAEVPIQCEVVMAPHHGSLRSNASALYDWCQPNQIVVSSGDARRGVAASETRWGDGQAEWFNTQAYGCVEVRLSADGQSPQIVHFLD